eukprot:1150300-Pelagomonas_calceolata.AAC.2
MESDEIVVAMWSAHHFSHRASEGLSAWTRALRRLTGPQEHGSKPEFRAMPPTCCSHFMYRQCAAAPGVARLCTLKQ